MFYIARTLRTATSEQHIIWRSDLPKSEKTRVGHFDLHFEGKTFHGTLILEQQLSDDEFTYLVDQIEDQLLDEIREDFIFTVYYGQEKGFYSDSVSEEERAFHGATKGDLEEIRSSLTKFLGRHQAARGKLAEHAVCSYFEALGYESKRATPELDALKIDVVAKNAEEIIYAQSKLGSISSSEIRKVVESVHKLPLEQGKKSVAAIVAKNFPKDNEFFRRKLEREFGISVLCIPTYQVISIAQEYKHTIEC